jgi:hypothetical protein
MARFLIALVLLALAGVTAWVGVPKVVLEHQVMQRAVQVPAVAEGASISERRGSKNKRYYEASPMFVADTPEGKVTSRFIDPGLDMTYSSQSRRRRDEWAMQYAQGVPLQVWYVPSKALPASAVPKIGVGNPLVFHEKRYPARDLVLVGVSVVLAGLGISVLGSKRGETPTTRAIVGSEPPMREVVGRRSLWPTAILAVIAALVAALPTAGLAAFLSFGAAGSVPTGAWWLLGVLGVVSLIMAFVAIHHLHIARMFAQPKVMIEQDALTVGRMNLIALSALAAREPLKPVTLTVMCERLMWVGSGKSRQLKRSTEWSHTLHGHATVTGAGAGGGAGGTSGAGGAGFAQHDAWQLDVPAHAPATRKVTTTQVGYIWTIKLKQQVRGAELAMDFPVIAREE